MTDEAQDSASRPFSQELEDWLRSDAPKSLGGMADTFGEKSFAVVIMLLLFPSALPIPTGGITDLFALVAAILAIELILGARTIWLPKWLRTKEAGAGITGRAVPFIVKRMQWFEKRSRPRWSRLFHTRTFARVHGLMLLLCCAGTIVAPPFSGLDTLPALGGVAIALSIILEDIVIFVIGSGIALGGIALIITLGAAAARFVKELF